MREKVSRWWHGEFIPYENDPNSGIMIIGGYERRHWTASAIRAALEFYMKHWQWVWGTGLALAALIISTSE